MKGIIKIILVFVSANCFSQSVVQNKAADEIKISKAKLASVISVKEIISDFPLDCLITSFECTANSKTA